MHDDDSESQSYDEEKKKVEEEEIELENSPLLPMTTSTKVLVTGGNGYLGSHIVYFLLEKGVKVRVSVHNIGDESRYQHLEKLTTNKDRGRLEIVEGVLSDRDSWYNILAGCDAVIHTASPNPYESPKLELDLIYPAVEGTLAILHAAERLGIKRIVLTSCYTAIKGGVHRLTYNEEKWGEPQNITGLEKSKLFAEKAAWFFQKQHSSKIDLTVFCPGLLFGPSIQDHYDFSSGIFFKKFMEGRITSLLQMHVPICDVRDAALAHVLALWNPKSFNQRYVCVQNSYWFENFSGVLSREFTSSEYRFPTKKLSVFPLKLISFFDSGVRNMLEFYGKESFYSNEKIKKDFSMIFRSFDETLIQMAEDFIVKGFIGKVSPKECLDEDHDAELNQKLKRTDNFHSNHSKSSRSGSNMDGGD